MTPLQGGLPQNRTCCGFAWFKFPKVLCAGTAACAFAHAQPHWRQLWGHYTATRPHAQEKKRGTPRLPGSHGMRMPVCVFEKNDGHSPAPNGHPPVRTGQQLCPNRSRWPKKAETGFFPPLRPQRLSCIISIIPRGRCQMAPRAAEALPIRRRQRRERFHPSAPVNTGSIASLSLPQRAAVALTHWQNFYC